MIRDTGTEGTSHTRNVSTAGTECTGLSEGGTMGWGRRGKRAWRGQTFNLLAPSRVRSLAGLSREVLLVTTSTSQSPGSMIFTPFLPPAEMVRMISLYCHGMSLTVLGVGALQLTAVSLAPRTGYGMHLVIAK